MWYFKMPTPFSAQTARERDPFTFNVLNQTGITLGADLIPHNF